MKFDFSARKSKARQKLPVCNYTIYKISLQNICVCVERRRVRERASTSKQCQYFGLSLPPLTVPCSVRAVFPDSIWIVRSYTEKRRDTMTVTMIK